MSHHRRPTIIETIFTGNHSCPHISIDPDFLHWAYLHRTVSGIACFLGIYRDTVWSALLEHGIVKPQENPFESHLEEPVVDVLPLEDNELLDPILPYPIHFHQTSNLAGGSGPFVAKCHFKVWLFWWCMYFLACFIGSLDFLLIFWSFF